MHPEVAHFVDKVREQFPVFFMGDKRVLEVGSYNINGSIRSLFEVIDYTGIDLGEGPGVDIVSDINDFDDPYGYDVVISMEMLEHCKEWEKALLKMYKLTRSGGLFILTCAGPARQEHGTHRTTPQDSKFTLDHYRNISVADFLSVLPTRLFKQSSISLEREDCDLLFWGIRK